MLLSRCITAFVAVIFISIALTSTYPIPPNHVTLIKKASRANFVHRALSFNHPLTSYEPQTTDNLQEPTLPRSLGPREPNGHVLDKSDSVLFVKRLPTKLHGAAWGAVGVLAIMLILLTGLLAGLTLGVMGVDMTRLRVWMRTGTEKRQRQAIAIFAIRRHSNWLLTSLILSGACVAQSLALCMNHLFAPGAIVPLIMSMVLVTVFGSLIPQAVVPLYLLDIASRMTWLVKIFMWLTSPLSVPIGWLVRCFKVWGKRKQGWRADGVMLREELGEFVRMHQSEVGLGGTLDNRLGVLLTGFIATDGGFVGQVSGWRGELKLDEAMDDDLRFVDVRFADLPSRATYPFVFVHDGQGVMVGVVMRTKLNGNANSSMPVYVKDLPIHAIPIVKEDSSLMALADWLMGPEERVALVIPATERLRCGPDGLSWTRGGRNGNRPQGPVTRTAIKPSGIMSTALFLRRLFLTAYHNPTAVHYHGVSWSESSDSGAESDESVHRRPRLRIRYSWSRDVLLSSGLRRRSNPPKRDVGERKASIDYRHTWSNHPLSNIPQIESSSDHGPTPGSNAHQDPIKPGYRQRKLNRSESLGAIEAGPHAGAMQMHAYVTGAAAPPRRPTIRAVSANSSLSGEHGRGFSLVRESPRRKTMASCALPRPNPEAAPSPRPDKRGHVSDPEEYASVSSTVAQAGGRARSKSLA